jgi:ribosomal protein S8
MVRTSVLNDALKSMNNAEKAGKRQVLIRPSSKVIIKVLQTMQKHGMFVHRGRHASIRTKVQVSCRTTPREKTTTFGMITRAYGFTCPTAKPL